MSFGFSVGDILAVIQLANKVRKDFAAAPNQFEHISTECVIPPLLLGTENLRLTLMQGSKSIDRALRY